MRPSQRWRDDSGVIHRVDEWVSWGFILYEDYQGSDDPADPGLDGRTAWETACGIPLDADDVRSSAHSSNRVTCMRCMSSSDR